MQNKLDLFLKLLLSFFFSLSITWNSYSGINYFLFAICFIIVFILVNFGWSIASKINFNKKEIKKREYFIFGGLILLALSFTVIAHYPGAISPDVIGQYNQAMNNTYNNWHPAMHTLVMYKLPQLFYKGLISSVIWQSLIIFGILLYFCHFLRKNFLNFRQTLAILLLIILNPLFLRYCVYMWKDVTFSWGIFLATLYMINIVISDGEWLKNHKNKIMFIISSLPILFFRHNGIVTFFILYLGIIIFYPKFRKFSLISLGAILISSFIIFNPVYKYFNIDNKTGGKSEMVGLLMGQISYYYNNDLPSFSEKELLILDNITPLKNWKLEYNPRNFNNIKYTAKDYRHSVEKNFNNILKIWFNKSIHSPALFVKSFLNMTSPIWQIERSYPNLPLIMYSNSGEIAEKGVMEDISNKYLQYVIDYNNLVTNSPLRLIFNGFGDGLCIILFALALVLKKAKLNFKYLLPFALVLSNTAVIMLLITGEEYRFVYSQAICALPLLIYSLSNFMPKDLSNKESKTKKLMKKYFTDKTDNTLIQFIRYIFVGGIAAVVNIGMLYVFTDLFRIHYIISNILAFTLGLIVNYLLSKKFVFQEKTSITKRKEFIIYAIIGVLGLGIDTLLIWIFTSICSIYYLLSKIISTLLVFIWNFGARKILYKVVK